MEIISSNSQYPKGFKIEYIGAMMRLSEESLRNFIYSFNLRTVEVNLNKKK